MNTPTIILSYQRITANCAHMKSIMELFEFIALYTKNSENKHDIETSYQFTNATLWSFSPFFTLPLRGISEIEKERDTRKYTAQKERSHGKWEIRIKNIHWSENEKRPLKFNTIRVRWFVSTCLRLLLLVMCLLYRLYKGQTHLIFSLHVRLQYQTVDSNRNRIKC